MEREDFIREIMGRKGLEHAPEGFTDRVMDRLQAESSKKPAPILSLGAWIGIISAIAAFIIIMLVIDIPFIDNAMSATGIHRLSMNIFSEGFLSGISTVFENFRLGNLFFVIILAAVLLYFVDRLLRKRITTTNLLVI
jgi:hypothetical protein